MGLLRARSSQAAGDRSDVQRRLSALEPIQRRGILFHFSGLANFPRSLPASDILEKVSVRVLGGFPARRITPHKLVVSELSRAAFPYRL